MTKKVKISKNTKERNNHKVKLKSNKLKKKGKTNIAKPRVKEKLLDKDLFDMIGFS